jgi:hypothetical protein
MFWKAHFVVYAVFTLLITIGAFAQVDAERFTWDAWLSLLLGLVGLVPLYGNAFNKAIGFRAVWGAVAAGMLVLDVIVPLAQLLPHWQRIDWSQSRWMLIVGEVFVVLLAIYFVAMLRYLFFRPALWRPA